MRANRRAQASKQDRDGEFLWLVSLSDLMILLFVFFVVLFTFSYKKMERTDFQEISAVLTGEATKPKALDDIQSHLLKWAMDRKLMDSVVIQKKEDALIIQIREGVLFESGSSHLKEETDSLLGTMALALAKVPAPYRLGIEGHTDDNPMRAHRKNQTAPDNWELSTLRALAVFRALELPSDLVSRSVIMGYGDTHPLVPNRDGSGRAIVAHQQQNRRVTIRIF